MKRTVLALLIGPMMMSTAAAQAPLAGHAPPAVEYSGHMQIWGAGLYAHGNNAGDQSPTIDDEFSPEFGGSARLTIPLNTSLAGRAVSVQLDLDSSANFANGSEAASGIDQSMGSTFLATGHISIRKSGRDLFGLFGGFGTASAASDEDAQIFLAGTEGQVHVTPDTTLYGQAGFFTADHAEDASNGDGIKNAWFLRMVGRHFLDDETFIEAEGTYGRGNIDPGEDERDSERDPMLAWGAKYQRRFSAERPFYYFAGYQGTKAENTGDGGRYSEHRAMFGLQFSFLGGLTERDNNHRGTTLSAPWAVGRWTGYAMEAID